MAFTLNHSSLPDGGGILLEPHQSMSLMHGLRQAALPAIARIPITADNHFSADPIVSVGDHVRKGQQIAVAKDGSNRAIHASISGAVVDIAEHAIAAPTQRNPTCIAIAFDGQDKRIKHALSVVDYRSLGLLEVQKRIVAAGVTGIGLSPAVQTIPWSTDAIELLILNAAECEPYITCHEMLVRQFSQDVILGLEILAYALQVSKCVIVIEENKKDTIRILQASLTKYTRPKIELKFISSLYPSSDDRQIIKSITGRMLSAQTSLADAGIVCSRVGQALAVKKAVIDGEPVIDCIVTVTGAGIQQPGNLIARIGTPVCDIIRQCGGYNEKFEYLVVGGPMTGFRLFSEDAPITDTTHCLLALDKDRRSSQSKALPCIRCDECANVCPLGLQAQQLHWYSQQFNLERLTDYHLFDCIECGCCAYICPSHIPLVDHYQQAKKRIKRDLKRRHVAQQNKKRYVAKQNRMKQKNIRRDQNQSVSKNEAMLSSRAQKKQEIAAAIERIKGKRKRNDT